MSGIFIMRKTRTGSVKIGESRNSEGPPPAEILGFRVGSCGNMTPDEKSIMSHLLHAEGFEMVFSSAEKISTWTHANGAEFEVEHLPRRYGFIERIS